MARPHGTKYIETPERLMDLFNEYKTFVDSFHFKLKLRVFQIRICKISHFWQTKSFNAKKTSIS